MSENNIDREISRHRDCYALSRFFYHDPAVYRRECERILFRSWLLAGHISQITDNGNFFQFEYAGESVIVCRDHEGEINALLNICRHRGARVCEAHHGSALAFSCPYHGWVYNLDGALKNARDFPEVDRASHGLFKLPLIIFHGLIFINFERDAPDFTPELALVESGIAGFDLANARIADSRTYTVEANWKLALENYLECYHCGRAHRAYARSHTLQALSDAVVDINARMAARSPDLTGIEGLNNEQYFAYDAAPSRSGGVDSARYALYEGYLTGSEDGQPVAPLMGAYQGYDGGAQDLQFGPLAFMLGYPDHCVVYRFVPRGIACTDMEVTWLVRGDAEAGSDYDLDRLTWLWDHTTREDEFIIRRNAAGVASWFFEPGPYHPEKEAMCVAFSRWYLQQLAQRSGDDPPQ